MDPIRMDRPRTSQSRRAVRLTNTVMFALVALRLVIFYADEGASLPEAVGLLAVFMAVFVTEPFLTRRAPALFHVYLLVQTVIVLALGLLQPYYDFAWVLYIVLVLQVVQDLPRRLAWAWTAVFVGLATVVLVFTSSIRLEGLAIGLNMIGVGAFIVSFAIFSQQAEVAGEESRALVEKLQTAHAELELRAAQAQELAATQERNQLARELHDSINQSIFSLTLTAEATRLMMDQDSSRVPQQLAQMQDMTGNALARLRGLITRLRPPETP